MKHLMGIFLFLFCVFTQASEIECQVKVGNKIFSNNDVQRLSEEQKSDLITMSNPSCCLRICGINNETLTPLDFDKLRNMPKFIQKGMIIKRCSYDKIIDDQRISSCVNVTTCCAVAAPFVEGLAWISMGCKISSTVLWGLVLGWAGAVATPCIVCSAYSCCEVCCGKELREEITFE